MIVQNVIRSQGFSSNSGPILSNVIPLRFYLQLYRIMNKEIMKTVLNYIYLII